MELPKDLKPIHIEKAVEYVEKETSELVDIYLEQANIFSAIVGIFGTKGLHSFSPYKKHKHPDIAAQRFPDLVTRRATQTAAGIRLRVQRQYAALGYPIALRSPRLVRSLALFGRPYGNL